MKNKKLWLANATMLAIGVLSLSTFTDVSAEESNKPTPPNQEIGPGYYDSETGKEAWENAQIASQLKANDVITIKSKALNWHKKTQTVNAPFDYIDKGKKFKILRRDGTFLNIQTVDGSYGGWVYDRDGVIVPHTTVKVNDQVNFKASASKWNKKAQTLNASVDSKDRNTTFNVLRRDGNMLNVQATDKSYGGWVFDWDME